MQKKPKKCFAVPYVSTASLIIKKHLCKLDPTIGVAFSGYNDNYSKFFTKTKDPVPILLNSELVYKIPCSNCDAVYIGETKQRLQKRIQQHKLDIKDKKTNNTGLSHHAKEKNHEFNFNNTKILCSEVNLVKRLFRETIEIKKDSNAVNFRTDLTD